MRPVFQKILYECALIIAKRWAIVSVKLKHHYVFTVYKTRIGIPYIPYNIKHNIIIWAYKKTPRNECTLNNILVTGSFRTFYIRVVREHRTYYNIMLPYDIIIITNNNMYNFGCCLRNNGRRRTSARGLLKLYRTIQFPNNIRRN